MQKESFEQLQKQSEEQFRKQFDPTSPTYHHGSQEPVPLGGDRVPDSMYSMYPEGYDPNKPVEAIDYGEQYKKIEEQRSVYQQLKHSLAKLCPVVEAFLRHDQIFKQKGNPKNQKHVKAHQENIKKQETNLAAVQQQLQAFLPQLKEVSPEGQQIGKELMLILQQSNIRYKNKEQLTNFNFKVKKLSSQSFSYAQKCLQRLKDIKKDYEKKKKAESEKKEQSKQQ